MSTAATPVPMDPDAAPRTTRAWVDAPWLRLAAPVVVGVVFVALWQFICTAFDVPVFLIPSPLAIATTLVEDWTLLSSALLSTLKVTFLAFFLAVVIGVAVAFLFVQNRLIEVSLFPYAVILQVTPIVAIAPLIIIWVKNPIPAMVICATIVALFPIISNTILGLRSVNPGLMNLFRLNKATRWQMLVRLRVPSALPYFFGGLRISSGLALIGAVVAEFVAGTGGTNAGLAYQILMAGYQLDIPRMFAALLLISLAGVFLFVLMAWLTKLCLGSWHASELAQD